MRPDRLSRTPGDAAPRTSIILTRLGVEHSISAMPPDGSCLYHCVDTVLRLGTRYLRHRVAAGLTHHHLELHNALASSDGRTEEVYKDLDSMRKRVREGEVCMGDEIDITLLSELLPTNMILVVIDDTYGSVLAYGEQRDHSALLPVLRSGSHYDRIHLGHGQSHERILSKASWMS